MSAAKQMRERKKDGEGLVSMHSKRDRAKNVASNLHLNMGTSGAVFVQMNVQGGIITEIRANMDVILMQ